MSDGRSRVVVLAALALAAGFGAGSCGGRPRRPDVVLVVVDTLRADRLSAYGYGRPTSPFLEQLASEGTLFHDVTCQFSWTMPSMVSLFTGHYVTAFKPTLGPEDHTLAQSFQNAGYRTVGLVANHLVSPQAGFDRGFDHFDSKPLPGTLQPEHRTLDRLASDLWDPLQKALEPEGGRRPPLFLYLHAFDPHDPYQHHPDLDGELPTAGAAPIRPADWQRRTLADLGMTAPANDPRWEHALEPIRQGRGRYDQEVRFTDRWLERIFDRLRELGVLDHCVVALVADHGECLWEHLPPKSPEELRGQAPHALFYQTHGAVVYEEVARTPMILWGAGVPAADVEQAVENVDLFPTLCELSNVAPPPGLHGHSLVELMQGRHRGRWRDYVVCAGVHSTGIRETATNLKLIVPKGASIAAGIGMQLYDVEADPDERTNLASARPADVVRLKAAWDRWVADHPTTSELSYEGSLLEREHAAHLKMLSDLGYTEFDTGVPMDEEPPKDEP